MENTLQTEVPNAEKTLYHDSNVTVTQSRMIVGSHTYAMRNISSVTNFEIKKIMCIIVGVIAIILTEGSSIWGWVCIVGGIILLFFKKSDFAVKISTNAGEPNTLISKDKNYIQTVVNAVNEAIIHRG